MDVLATVGHSDSDMLCRMLLRGLVPATAWIAFAITEAITCCRLYAMYGGQKKILIPALVLLFCSSGTSLGIWVWSLGPSNALVSGHLLPGLNICVAIESKDTIYAAAIPHLIFDGIACGMLIYRLLTHWKTLSRSIKSNPLLSIIQRDTAIYFFINFMLYATNLLIWRYGAVTLALLFIGITVAIESVLGNRMLLNLRAADATGREHGYESEMTLMQFRTRSSRSGSKQHGESFL